MIRRPGRRSSAGTAVPPYSDQQLTCTNASADRQPGITNCCSAPFSIKVNWPSWPPPTRQ